MISELSAQCFDHPSQRADLHVVLRFESAEGRLLDADGAWPTLLGNRPAISCSSASSISCNMELARDLARAADAGSIFVRALEIASHQASRHAQAACQMLIKQIVR